MFKQKWKQCPVKAINDTKDKRKASQARYNWNFDQMLRKNNEKSNNADQAYLLLDRKNYNEKRQKIAPIDVGPFTVTNGEKIQDHRPWTIRSNFWECIPRPSPLAQRTETKYGRMTEAQLQNLAEIVSKYPVVEDHNPLNI